MKFSDWRSAELNSQSISTSATSTKAEIPILNILSEFITPKIAKTKRQPFDCLPGLINL